MTAELGASSSELLHSLRSFLMALSTGTDRLERARLTATGLGSLIACRVSGLALIDRDHDLGWVLAVHQAGRELAGPEAEHLLPDLIPILEKSTGPGIVETPRPLPALGEDVDLVSATAILSVRERLGVIFTGCSSDNPLNKEARFVLSTLAQHFAIGLESLSLYEDLESYSERLAYKTELVLESAGEGIYGLDTDGRATFVNPAAARMLGWEVGELIGRRMHDVIHPMRPNGSPYPQEDCPIYAAFMDGEVHTADDETFTRKDGSTFAVEYTSTPAREDGTLVGAVVVFHDISERRRLEEERQRAFQEIARLKDRLEQECEYLREEVQTVRFGSIVGDSPALKKTLARVEAVAGTDATVLVLGESGVGKELVAGAIHDHSPRRSGPLIKVNCAAVSAELFESEFFGHVKGAFTGAQRARPGRFLLAHGGTIFLDEVAEIPLALQSKLLRVLQEGQFEPVGGDQTRTVDLRVIAATNRDLAAEVEQGRFRADLYYRLSVFPIEIPPLRERVDDIVPLASLFLKRACREFGREELSLTRAQAKALETYDWPGNARELRNIVERAVILSPNRRLRLDLALPEVAGPPREDLESSFETGEMGRAFVTAAELKARQRANLVAALEHADWRISGSGGAADLLGIKPTTLRSQMQREGIAKPGKGEG